MTSGLSLTNSLLYLIHCEAFNKVFCNPVAISTVRVARNTILHTERSISNLLLVNVHLPWM